MPQADAFVLVYALIVIVSLRASPFYWLLFVVLLKLFFSFTFFSSIEPFLYLLENTIVFRQPLTWRPRLNSAIKNTESCAKEIIA